MNGIFTTLLNMSLVSSLLILAVVLVRLIFKKAPKSIICVLWALVGLRLICPFSIESMFSLVPDAEPADQISQYAVNAIYDSREYVTSDDGTRTDAMINLMKTARDISILETVKDMLPYVWILGMVIMAAVSCISYIRLRRHILVSVNKGENVWLCDGIKTPFILGVIRPKIYIPSYLSESEMNVVIAHEKAHLQRRDHLWKPLGYLILTLHWFNPLVWLAYALLCRDIESACDQRVIRDMTVTDKKLYTETLLSCSAPRHILTACPVAFGEVGVKERVKSVLSYKKPTLWIIIAAVVVCAVVAVVFMTNPLSVKSDPDTPIDQFLNEIILKENENEHTDLYYPCESHEILTTEENGYETTYYMVVRYGEYQLEDYKVVQQGAGAYTPTAITVRELSNGGYELVEYWEPQSGELYTADVKAKFPSELHDKVLLGTAYANDLARDCENQAYEHFGVSNLTSSTTGYPRFSAEVLEVGEDKLLVAPSENSYILGKSYDKVYISRNADYGGDADFTRGDILSVTYGDIVEDSEPPILPDIKSISITKKVFDVMTVYNADFYREYYEDREHQVYVYLYADDDRAEYLEVYRYMPETPLPPEDYDGTGTCSVEERFAPYIVIDRDKKQVTFACASDITVSGIYEETDDKLVMTTRHTTWDSPRDELYVFNKVDGGYAFDKESSALIDSYAYELNGKVYDTFPDGAVFTNDFIVVP